MKVSILILAVAFFSGLCSAIPEHATMTRPPAFPLSVRNPYTNFWLNRNELPGNWASFWTGSTKAWTGFARVDGETYLYMGNPNVDGERLGTLGIQGWSAITPTQTIFEIKTGGVNVSVNFFSPVEYEDIMRQSIPLTYVDVSVYSNDGASHQVELYMDISGEWAANDVSKEVQWARSVTPNGHQIWTAELSSPNQFVEWGDYPEWGQAVLATDSAATYQSGADVEVRPGFLSTGSLPNTNDEDFRCASCDWPVFGFAHDLGQVADDGSASSVRYIVGLVRETNANFLGEEKTALWLDYWATKEELVDFYYDDRDEAIARADALDIRILDDAFAAGGQYHCDILSLSLRQAFAGNEFSGTRDEPIYYQKEISSGAFVQTVDVIYPATPMYYYLNITYLKLLLDPLFYQMENGIWTKPFAMHDIGAPYPNMLGQAYGGDMPVEESANMIMMVADIIFHPTADQEESLTYASTHYTIMTQWADYLYHNCLYPVNQLTTDDFIGPTELNSGLALKGILGMSAFARISEFLGETAQANYYNEAVANYTPIWLMESLHNDRDHLKMEYNVTDGYQFKYNAFHDKLLGLNVVPQEVYDMEAAYYLTKLEPYGIPFVSTHDYTKSDWEMWTAAAFGDSSPELKEALIEALGLMLRFTGSRVPFTDWYVTATANQVGFQSRPVAGGHFALLALEVAKRGRK